MTNLKFGQVESSRSATRIRYNSGPDCVAKTASRQQRRSRHRSIQSATSRPRNLYYANTVHQQSAIIAVAEHDK